MASTFTLHIVHPDEKKEDATIRVSIEIEAPSPESKAVALKFAERLVTQHDCYEWDIKVFPSKSIIEATTWNGFTYILEID